MRNFNDVERDTFAVPLRHGGRDLVVQNPILTRKQNFLRKHKQGIWSIKESHQTIDWPDLQPRSRFKDFKLDKSLMSKPKAELKLDKEKSYAAENNSTESFMTSVQSKCSFKHVNLVNQFWYLSLVWYHQKICDFGIARRCWMLRRWHPPCPILACQHKVEDKGQRQCLSRIWNF